MRIENNIVNEKPELTAKTPVQQEQVVVTIGHTEESKTDTKKPVNGYYIEKTTNIEKNDDDKLDTSINPDAVITLKNPSIAIYKESSEINNVMKQAVDIAVANVFQDTGQDSYFKAASMLKNKQAYGCFDDINFEKNFNVYGKAVYEGTKFLYTTNLPSKVKRQENSIKTDLGLNYKSKSGNTKVMLFSSFTKKNTNINTTYSESTEIPQNEYLNIKYNNKSHSLYGALQQHFKNKDFGTLSAYHINDGTQESKITNITASYFLNKYMAMTQGSLNSHKVFNQKAITKLDFNISFNPELALTEHKANESSQQDAEAKSNTKTVSQTNLKTWSKEISPFFDTQSINGSTEEGLGIQMRFKRNGNSKLRVGAFGKISTTQQEENNQYHVTFGSGIKYVKDFSMKSKLTASFDFKDRITFGKGNIATSGAIVSYVSPKVTAEIEGKYINITHPDSPNFRSVESRLFYTHSKNLNLFIECCLAEMKEPNYKTSGLNIQIGAISNF